MKLGVNIDHVATIRNARGGAHPSLVDAAKIAAQSGAHGITIHLREDRRHIRDNDLNAIKNATSLPINFEIAATAEMQQIALKLMPNAVCIVPEKREELTTEGGLEVAGRIEFLKEYIKPLKKAGILVSLFIDPDNIQVQAAHKVEADIIELHTGAYAAKFLENNATDELQKIKHAVLKAYEYGLICHAGHGLNYENVVDIVKLEYISELNIGHFLIGEAIFTGLSSAITTMLKIMNKNR